MEVGQQRTGQQRVSPAPAHDDSLALILAGGQGSRLGEMTRWHAKPALPFGGKYRNVDFALSNCMNSGVRRIALLTQYKAHSLIQHVQQAWGHLSRPAGEFVEIWPAQQRIGDRWYAGTADAVFQNIDLIEQCDPDCVLVLAGDHVYRMDYRPMVATHIRSGADVTVGCVEVPVASASRFGIARVAPDGRITAFHEKPETPLALPDRPDSTLASMGIYVFERQTLIDCLAADACNEASRHDFGHSILPRLVSQGRAHAYEFVGLRGDRPGYWRDVGTLESYWATNMDLLTTPPAIDLHDRHWPIWTVEPQCPPARFGLGCRIESSLIAAGCDVDGALSRSVLFTQATVGAGSIVESSLILPGARIGKRCEVRGAIIDSGVVIADGSVIGSARFRGDWPYAAHERAIHRAGITLIADTAQGEAASSVLGTAVASN